MFDTIKNLIGKLFGSKIDENKEKNMEKFKNPEKYGLIELRDILTEIKGFEHILDKAKPGTGIKIQIKGGKVLEVKNIDEESLNQLVVNISNLESKLKKWHNKNKILNSLSDEFQEAYWNFYNFFEKDRNQINQEDIIKFVLRRKELLEKIGIELEKINK